jgi:hypothetical protein
VETTEGRERRHRPPWGIIGGGVVLAGLFVGLLGISTVASIEGFFRTTPYSLSELRQRTVGYGMVFGGLGLIGVGTILVLWRASAAGEGPGLSIRRLIGPSLFVLGIAALGTGAVLRGSAYDNPWFVSIAESPNGQASTGMIDLPNGQSERFTGTRVKVDTWLERRERELRDEYGLARKETIGDLTQLGGLALTGGGALWLAWRGATRRRRVSVD